MEHESEGVPDAEETRAADGVRKNLRHADRERRRSARTIPKRDLADCVSEIGHGLRLQRIAPTADGCGAGICSGPNDARWAVDGEVDARSHGASRDHGHHADKRFEQHGSVTDQARVAFAENHFRRGAGRDQRMKTADGAASDGDEAKGEDLAGKDGPRTVNEAREWGMSTCGQTTRIPAASEKAAPALENPLTESPGPSRRHTRGAHAVHSQRITAARIPRPP